MQDFTGVPGVVDLAAMRDALAALGGDPGRINPLVPVDLVIDHSVIAERSGTADAFDDERRPRVRAQHRALPAPALGPGRPSTASASSRRAPASATRSTSSTWPGWSSTPRRAAPTPTPSSAPTRTPRWSTASGSSAGASAASRPRRRCSASRSRCSSRPSSAAARGELPDRDDRHRPGAHHRRAAPRHGVVGKFVECFGPGVAPSRSRTGRRSATCRPSTARPARSSRSTTRRSTTCASPAARGPSPWSRPTPRSRASGTSRRRRAGLLRDARARPLDRRAEPRRPGAPQDRVVAGRGRGAAFRTALGSGTAAGVGRATATLDDGARPSSTTADVVIAAITSCTNTSNPQVMVAAGLLARRPSSAGLTTKPWVKTSLAPGSRVVMDYLERAGLIEPLESSASPSSASAARPASATPGRCCRNLRGGHGLRPGGRRGALGQPQLRRPHPPRRQDELPRSPPLVVAYALAGTMDIDLYNRAARHRRRRRPGRPARPLAERARDRRDHPGVVSSEMFRRALRLGLRGRRALGWVSVVGRRDLRLGPA